MNRPNVATMIHILASVPDQMCSMDNWWCSTSGCIAGWTAATFSTKYDNKAFLWRESDLIAQLVLDLNNYQAAMIFRSFPRPDDDDDDKGNANGHFYNIWMLGRLQYALDHDGDTPHISVEGVTETIIELGTQVYERERAFIREMNIDPERPVQPELCAPEGESPAVCDNDLVCVETELQRYSGL